MADRKTARLCCLITTKQFGPIVAEVVRCLLEDGRSTLRSIIAQTKLSKNLVREALFILIQHGLVKYSDTIQGLDRIVIHYVALEKEIMLRDRAATFLKITRERIGYQAADIVMHLLVFGNQSYDSIIASCGIDCESEFLALKRSGFIMEYTSKDSRYSVDTIMQEEADAVAKLGVPLTKLELAKLRKKMAQERGSAAGLDEPAQKKIRLEESEAQTHESVVIDVC